jgi:hypothetical protein
MKISSLYVLIAIGIITIFGTSCSKIETKRFKMEVTTNALTIPPGTNRSDSISLSISQTLNVSSILSEGGMSLSNMVSASMPSFRLDVLSPQDETFRFCEKIIVFMSAEDLPEIMVAWKHAPFRVDFQPLYLIRTGVDLAPYLARENVRFRFEIKMRRVFPTTTSFAATPVFFIETEKEK